MCSFYNNNDIECVFLYLTERTNTPNKIVIRMNFVPRRETIMRAGERVSVMTALYTDIAHSISVVINLLYGLAASTDMIENP